MAEDNIPNSLLFYWIIVGGSQPILSNGIETHVIRDAGMNRIKRERAKQKASNTHRTLRLCALISIYREGIVFIKKLTTHETS